MNLKVGIIITAYNCVNYTRQCFGTIKTTYPSAVIFVDDYSDDGTKEWLQEIENEYEDVAVITDPDTDSLSAKWNLGIDKAKELGCNLFLICNNDIIFNPVTINALIKRFEKAFENNENIGIVSAHNRRADVGPDSILELEPPEDPTEADSPDFSCYMLSEQALDLVGRFDEEYVPCFFEDNDYHIRLAQNNLRAICITSAPYYHYGSVTQNSIEGGICSGTQFEANRDYFEQKFGFKTVDKEYGETIKQCAK